MDAFSLSLIYGTLNISNIIIRIVSSTVGIFHFFMPLFGYLFGDLLSSFLVFNPNNLVSIIFVYLAIQMFLSVFKQEEVLEESGLKTMDSVSLIHNLKNKQFKNTLDKLFPAKLVPLMIELSGIDPEKKVNEITKEERKNLVSLIKNWEMTITGTRGFREAIITQGGVNVKQVNPSTMESKVIPGLFMAGEMLDIDALTGGFNLQLAWSTGYLAGNSIE